MTSQLSPKMVVKLFIIAIVITILLWLIAIVQCEMLTLHHGSEFDNRWQEYTMLDEPQQLKVLEYNENTAKIYLFNSDGGDVLFFSRYSQTSDWSFESWETIWSKTGSADGFVWPYIR